MDSLGLFDPELRVECLVDPAFVLEGWYDPEMVGTGVAPPIPPKPTPTPPARGERLSVGTLRVRPVGVQHQSILPVAYVVGIQSANTRITNLSGGGKVSLGPLRVK